MQLQMRQLKSMQHKMELFNSDTNAKSQQTEPKKETQPASNSNKNKNNNKNYIHEMFHMQCSNNNNNKRHIFFLW